MAWGIVVRATAFTSNCGETIKEEDCTAKANEVLGRKLSFSYRNFPSLNFLHTEPVRVAPTQAWACGCFETGIAVQLLRFRDN
jgi:hypothetical protein